MTGPQDNFGPTPSNDFTKLDGSIPFFSRKLKRSHTNSMLFGVLAGIAETYRIDATMLRLAFVIASLFFPVTVLVYIAAVVLMWNT